MKQRKLHTDGLPARLAAMTPGQSLVLADVSVNAARMAARRTAARTGTPYEVRLEGLDEKNRRLVVYCGQASARVFTTKQGIRRVIAKRHLHSAMGRAGLATRAESWFGFNLEELKAQVDRGFARFCAGRGLDPRWA